MDKSKSDIVAKMDSMFGSDSEDETEVIVKQPRTPSEIAVCKLVSEVGGGRGVFAKSRIEAGCLIIAENSFVDWKNDTDFSDPATLITVIRKIVCDPVALTTSRNLYPQTIDDMKKADYDKMVSLIDEIELRSLSNDASLDMKELVRVGLVLQHNGFQCGLYEQQCLINHSCNPNCVKFNPKTSFSPSEIWSTRVIEPNEEISICYVTPYECATWSMRKYLWENHRFICCCSKCKSNDKIKNLTEDAFTSPSSADIEESLKEEITFEEELEAMEATLEALENDRQLSVHDISSECASIEEKLYKLMSETLKNDANFNKLLIARGHKVSLSCNVCNIGAYDKLSAGIPLEIAIAYLENALQVYMVQHTYLGNDHPDIATTLFDINNAIMGLIEAFPKYDFEEFDPSTWQLAFIRDEECSDAKGCAKLCLAEANRIKSLYKKINPLLNTVTVFPFE